MADPAESRDSAEGMGSGLPSGPAPGTPRWVKVFVIVALALVALVLVMALVGGGNHGPGRHFGSSTQQGGMAGGQPPPGDGHG